MQGSALDKMLTTKKCPAWSCQKLLDKKQSNQKEMAERLGQSARIPTTRLQSLADIPSFETLLQVDVLVLSACQGNKFITVPQDRRSDRQRLYLHLVHDEQENIGHFHAIAKITSFFHHPYFCNYCLMPYKSWDKHHCLQNYIICKTDGCEKSDAVVVCAQCNIIDTRWCRAGSKNIEPIEHAVKRYLSKYFFFISFSYNH